MKLSGIITMVVSLLISIVSGYCTVVGFGNVFASAAAVSMFIASVIEVGRVVLIYDLHHYWQELKLFQKIPGICMLLISITLSALGIFGFMSNAHSERTRDVIPIEMKITEKEQQISILNNAIQINEKQLAQFDGKALDKYTEMGYVTKAVNLQKEQQKITNKLYDDNRLKQEEITKLNQEILSLKLDAEKKAPTLAHIKYYAKLFNVDDDTAIIIFIVMIMLVFDTLAMYLMVTADWINNRDKEKSFIVKKEEILKGLSEEEIRNKMDALQSLIDNFPSTVVQDTPNYDKRFEALEQMIDSASKLSQNDIKSIIETGLQPISAKLEKTNNNEELINRLDQLAEKIGQNNIDNGGGNSILLDKITNSIDNNEDVILSERFSNMIKENPQILKSLKKTYSKVPSVIEKLNKIER